MKHLIKYIALFVLSLLTIAWARAPLSEIIFSADTVLTSSIEIPIGKTCTINPGVTLKFAGYHALVVRGLLIARGTTDRPILITSIGRERGSMEKPGWQGIQIVDSTAHAFIGHLRCEGAYRTMVWGGRFTADSCEFAGNHYAIYCAKKAVVNIKGCRIYRNAYGIVADNTMPLLLDNIITENRVGLSLILAGKTVLGKNIIEGNNINIQYQDWNGSKDNGDTLSLEHLWELMNQLY